jgi:hypothetical protein
MNGTSFYVYMYLRAYDSKNGCKGSPYYIGKGKGKRSHDKNHTYKIPTDHNNIRIIVDNISEDEAFMWEEFWISFFGRIDIESGCLRNLTDGGEGRSGSLPWNKGVTGYKLHSEEYKQKVKSRMQQGLVALYGAERATKIRKKMAESLRGRSHEDIHGEKSESLKKQISDKLSKPLIDIIGKDKFANAMATRIKTLTKANAARKIDLSYDTLLEINEKVESGMSWEYITSSYGCSIDTINRNFREKQLKKSRQRYSKRIR